MKVERIRNSAWKFNLKTGRFFNVQEFSGKRRKKEMNSSVIENGKFWSIKYYLEGNFPSNMEHWSGFCG